jgi:hypothetical protein
MAWRINKMGSDAIRKVEKYFALRLFAEASHLDATKPSYSSLMRQG